jgi:hypothetical protein
MIIATMESSIENKSGYPRYTYTCCDAKIRAKP